MKTDYYNISDMSDIDGYKSRQSIFNNIDIRHKIFGIKADKIKDAMKRNEKIVKFNKLYWDRVLIFESLLDIQRSLIHPFYKVERVSIRPKWSKIDDEDSYIYDMIEGWSRVGDNWNEYLEFGNDDIYLPHYE